jgi:hypothetical protein
MTDGASSGSVLTSRRLRRRLLAAGAAAAVAGAEAEVESAMTCLP